MYHSLHFMLVGFREGPSCQSHRNDINARDDEDDKGMGRKVHETTRYNIEKHLVGLF